MPKIGSRVFRGLTLVEIRRYRRRMKLVMALFVSAAIGFFIGKIDSKQNASVQEVVMEERYKNCS